MTHPLKVPNASADPVVLADFVELRALWAADGCSSLQELIQDIRRSGTVDAMEDLEEEYGSDVGAEISEPLAEAAFSEIDDRSYACGGIDGAYPFNVESGYIELRDRGEESLYAYMLLLTWKGVQNDKSGTDAARLFEDICTHAAGSYVGGPAIAFGFPRRVAPAGFADAVDYFCAQTGEGNRCERGPRTRRLKDANLDVVAWRGFADGRQGKLMGFGQCAAGGDWASKVTDLNPLAFCRNWMREVPAVLPVPLFFVPRRIERHRWREITSNGGILFDRCRIAQHVNGIDDDIRARCSAWNEPIISELAA